MKQGLVTAAVATPGSHRKIELLNQERATPSTSLRSGDLNKYLVFEIPGGLGDDRGVELAVPSSVEGLLALAMLCYNR